MCKTSQILATLMLILPLSAWAQDDMYFVPKKKSKTEKAASAYRSTSQRYVPVEIVYADDEPLDVSGSTRDVDEYNRRRPAGTSSQAELVQQPDGTFAYQIPANDTLYWMKDSLALTTGSLANNAYTQGYNDGYVDGEDYALTRRMGRFGYAGVYISPWYWSYYNDPFYWNDWYWGVYDPYWYGYYGWHRPYWGYAGYYGYRPWSWYHPYHHWGYYGGGYYHGGHHGGHSTYSSRYGSRYGNLRTANRTYSVNRGRGTVRSARPGQTAPIGSRGSSYITRGSGSTTSGTRSSGSSVSGNSRSSSVSTSSRSGSGGFGGAVRGGSSSGSTRSSGGFSGGSSRGGGFSGGGFSGGSHGGGFGGGSRGGRR